MSMCGNPVSQLRRCAEQAVVVVVAVTAFSSVPGCGVGEYRQRIAARVSELATASEFAGLYAAQQLGDKPVSVRVPQAFQRQPLVAGAEIAEEGSVPDEARVKPGLIDLSGLTYTYEEFVADAEGGQIPYYLYLGAEKTTAPGYREPSSRWLSQVKSKLPDQDVKWEAIECDTPEGRTVMWRRLRAEGDQPFYYMSKEGESRIVQLPGVFEVYHRVDGEWSIALAWRMPEIIADHVNLDKRAPMVAGTVQLQADSDRAGAP